jgi:hypothetical protein
MAQRTPHLTGATILPPGSQPFNNLDPTFTTGNMLRFAIPYCGLATLSGHRGPVNSTQCLPPKKTAAELRRLQYVGLQLGFFASPLRRAFSRSPRSSANTRSTTSMSNFAAEPRAIPPFRECKSRGGGCTSTPFRLDSARRCAKDGVQGDPWDGGKGSQQREQPGWYFGGGRALETERKRPSYPKTRSVGRLSVPKVNSVCSGPA